jgi:hypothetical protein
LPHEKFHTIIWNVPWGYVEEDVSELERSVHDPFYASIAECILKAREYLLSKGRILLGFSTSLGKFDKLQKLAQEGGLVSTILAQRPASDDNPVSVEWVELR